MTLRLVVTGTDTGIGKTVVSAGLTGLLDGIYWKPIQSGTDGGTDREVVGQLAELPPDRLLPEAYRLSEPLSPHRAAELDGVTIDPDRLSLPDVERPLIVEGAGGLMVPITRTWLFIDLFAAWRVPVVLCARTALGTINHTLLSIEALRRRDIPLAGIAFVGDAVPDTERTIAEMAEVPVLGRLPLLSPLTPDTLRAAMRSGFDLTVIEQCHP